MNAVYTLVSVVSLLLCSTSNAARLVQGVALWFEVECPPGWSEVTSSHGRAILSDPLGNQLGKTVVGSPLGLKEEPFHTHTAGAMSHTYGEETNMGCDGGASSTTMTDFTSSYSATSMSVTPTDSASFSSGIPLAQLKLCSLSSNSIDLSVPAGTLVYLDTTVSVCPTGFSARSDADGRFLVFASGSVALNRKSDEELLNNSVSKLDTSFGVADQKSHSHPQSVFVATSCLRVTNSEACDGFYDHAEFVVGEPVLTGTSSSAETNLPYLQLMTCEANTAAETTFPPFSALMFYVNSTCPAGWKAVRSDLAGRVLVGTSGTSGIGDNFGEVSGFSLAVSPTAPEVLQAHSHTITGGELILPGARTTSNLPRLFDDCGVSSREATLAGTYAIPDFNVVAHDITGDLPYSALLGCEPDPTQYGCGDFSCYLAQNTGSFPAGVDTKEEAQVYFQTTGFYNGDDCRCITDNPTVNPTVTAAPTTESPTTMNPTLSPQSSEDDGIPIEALAGIVGGAVGGVFMLASGLYCYARRQNRKEVSFAVKNILESVYSRDPEAIHGPGQVTEALYNFDAKHADEMSIRRGEEYIIRETDDEAWLLVTNPDTSESGIVPRNIFYLSEEGFDDGLTVFSSGTSNVPF